MVYNHYVIESTHINSIMIRTRYRNVYCSSYTKMCHVPNCSWRMNNVWKTPSPCSYFCCTSYRPIFTFPLSVVPFIVRLSCCYFLWLLNEDMKNTPRVPDDIPLMAIGYTYNSRKFLGFIYTEGSVSTEPADPYLSTFRDTYSNVSIWPFFHPTF